MSSQLDKYQYLFEQGFMEKIEDENNKDNPWVKHTDKFRDLLTAKLIELTIRHPKSKPDEILVYAVVRIIQENDKKIPEERAVDYGCYLYNALKNGNVYRKIIRTISSMQEGSVEYQELQKVKKL
jgi:hypothetical protein